MPKQKQKSKQMHQNQKNNHIPVLVDAMLEYLSPSIGESYLDLTAGYGGHAAAVLERTLTPAKAVLVDRDKNAVDELRIRFKDQPVSIVQKDFLAASQNLLKAGTRFDLILADLGVSSPHLNTASRGFSIRLDGPLDMRMDQSQDLSAETIVNSYREAELAEIIRTYGEEPKAKKIAHAIVTNRPVAMTSELADIIAKSVGWRAKGSKIHPATKSFQALRIAVNSELEQIKQALPVWLELLKPGGRLVVISFHSLEDRLVKQALASVSGNRYDASLKLLTKHPVTAANHEIVFNPRARSAKLRAAAKIKNQTERRD